MKAGQTLGTIAAGAGVSLATVLELNPQIKNPDVTHSSDKVSVPGEAPAKPASDADGYPGPSTWSRLTK